MQNNNEKKISKSLSFWLRHNPDDIGIELKEGGWVDIDELIDKASSKIEITLEDLKRVVKNNDKQRFSINEEQNLIRANQGHSIDVKIDFEQVVPPKFLYHGTPVGIVDIILKEGLNKMSRTHVHLSKDVETAKVVGSRRGEFVVLEIEALRMRADGYKIYKSENGVFLVDEVPSKYIKLFNFAKK